MVDKNANMSVIVTTPWTDTHYRQPQLDVLLNSGTSYRTTALDLYALAEPVGYTIPALRFCPGDYASALRFFRNQLGAALSASHQALTDASPLLTATVAALNDATEAVDKVLALNPDTTTPNNTTDLTNEIGGLNPTTDREELERRVGEILDINVVNGVLFPKGSTRLGPLRQLTSAANVTATNPDFTRFGKSTESFVLVTTETVTTERVVGSTCGEPIVEYVVTERYVATNSVISGDVNLNLFWFDRISADQATQMRMRALGLTNEEIAGALTGQAAGRIIATSTVDTSILPTLFDRLTDAEVATLLSRDDTSAGVNLAATDSDVVRTIQDAINSSTGGNRNRAGTSDSDIKTGRAGRGGDPALMLFGLVDFFRSFPNYPRTSAEFASLREDYVDSEPCTFIINLLDGSVVALQALLLEAQSFIQQTFGNLGLGLHRLDAGIGFASCLASFNLGVDVGVQLSAALPFRLQLLLVSFGALLAAVVAAVAAIRSVLCIPQGMIELLFGGVCGFKPFDFTLCPTDIRTLLDRLVTIVSLVTSLVSRITASLMTMRVDMTSTLRKSFELKAFSLCAVPAMPIGVALGLAVVPGATVTTSIAVTTPNEQVTATT